jgi:hypothetical protein
MERTTVDSLLRTTQAWCSQLCAKQTLDYGIAYYSQRFPGLPEVNQFREVIVEETVKIPVAYEQAEEWFAEKGLFCYRWAPAEGRPSEPLSSFLEAQGFRPRQDVAMLLTDWVHLEPVPGVRILSARAMRGAFRRTLTGSSPPGRACDDAVEAYVERLDDPQFDMFVAMKDKRPAGRCALYQVGDIARIMDLAVPDLHAAPGVTHALLGHVLALAKRLVMRNICTQLHSEDSAVRALFESAGFVADGEIVEFQRARPAGRA